jgi:hypothetical protein
MVDALSLGGSTTIDGFSGLHQIKMPLRTPSELNMTLQFERKGHDLKLGGSVIGVLQFFLRIFRDKIGRTLD